MRNMSCMGYLIKSSFTKLTRNKIRARIYLASYRSCTFICCTTFFRKASTTQDSSELFWFLLPVGLRYSFLLFGQFLWFYSLDLHWYYFCSLLLTIKHLSLLSKDLLADLDMSSQRLRIECSSTVWTWSCFTGLLNIFRDVTWTWLFDRKVSNRLRSKCFARVLCWWFVGLCRTRTFVFTGRA